MPPPALPRRSVIEANEAVAYPVFGHAVEL